MDESGEAFSADVNPHGVADIHLTPGA